MKPSLEDFVTVVAASFLTDQDKIQHNTPFRDLASWTSLQSLMVVATIDDNYGVALLETELKAARTFADLHQTIIQKSN